MTKRHPLENRANATIRYLKEQELLTDEHALTVELIKQLAAEWSEAASSTQRAAISKELRYCIGLLPKPEVTTSDEADDFLKSLNDDG